MLCQRVDRQGNGQFLTRLKARTKIFINVTRDVDRTPIFAFGDKVKLAAQNFVFSSFCPFITVNLKAKRDSPWRRERSQG